MSKLFCSVCGKDCTDLKPSEILIHIMEVHNLTLYDLVFSKVTKTP